MNIQIFYIKNNFSLHVLNNKINIILNFLLTGLPINYYLVINNKDVLIIVFTNNIIHI